MLPNIFVVLLCLIIIASWLKKKIDKKLVMSSKEFFLHGENLTLQPLIATLVSSNLSLGNMVFICGMLGYFSGWSGVFWVVITIVALGGGFVIFGKTFKEYVEQRDNFGTIHDYISHHHDIESSNYRLSAKITAAITSILSLVIALILEVHLGTKFLSHIFSIEQNVLVFLVIFAVAAYTVTGGFRAVVYTDVIQFFCMVAAIIGGIFLFNLLPEGKSFSEVGYKFSVAGMLTGVGWQTAVGLVVLGFFWLVATPDTWQRNCASRSIDVSISGAIIGTILMCMFVATFAIGGMFVKSNLEPLVSVSNSKLLSGGYFTFSDIFLLDYSSYGIEVNILLALVAIGLLMAAISTIDTFLIVVGHVFNVDLGLSLKNIKNFRDVEEHSLDENLLLRGRVFLLLLSAVVAIGWLLMERFGLLKDPLSLFFVTYTIQFCLAIPVIAAKNNRTRGARTTSIVIILSAIATVVVGLWGMLNINQTATTLGMTPVSWMAVLPVIPIVVGFVGYAILYFAKPIMERG